jgi:hypothetical protein
VGLRFSSDSSGTEQLHVDPTDDCTFSYTNEYHATTGSFNWSTRARIGSFKFNSCEARNK